MDYESIKRNLKTLWGSKRTEILIILAAAAVMLILLPDLNCTRTQKPAEYSDPAETYARQLESKLTQVISAVDGAGEVQVMVTLRNGVEYIYASEDATSTDSSATTDSSGRQSSDEREDRQSSYIIIDTDSGEQALVRTEMMPTVSGVVVVCRGADDPEVSRRILDVVTTALDISPKRVCITQLSQ